MAHAAALATPGVISHESAAALHRLGLRDDRTPNRAVHVIVPPRLHAVVPGVIEHRLTLPAADQTDLEGIPITTRHRTVVDLLASLPRQPALAFLSRCHQNGIVDQPDLWRAIDGREGMHSTPQLRELAAMLGTGAHSVAEHKLHEILASIPGLAWQANAPVEVEGRRFKVDVLVPAARLIIEIDGRGFHSDDAAFQHDRERQNLLLLTRDFTILRFTWLDVANRPEHVRAQIIAACRSAA